MEPFWDPPFRVIQSQDLGVGVGGSVTLAGKEEWGLADTSYSNLLFLSDIQSWFCLGTSGF